MKRAEETLFGNAGDQVETVTEFTRRVKTLLEGGIRPGWVKGEISNLRTQASGHVYFSLKDAGAQLSAVLFRGDAVRQGVRLRDGMQALVYGEISVYEPRGQYQFIVRAVIEDGVGRLQREFEALKRRLADEGLFDAARKAPIPLMPATVGFITSPTGAAVQDFIRILERRGWRGRLVVLPVKVQGEGAAGEMAAMLRLAEDLRLGPEEEPVFESGEWKAESEKANGQLSTRNAQLPTSDVPDSPLSALRAPLFFDLLVIGRGGGSLEDLWAFNEEVLVRSVAACGVPIISAVGHEIDFTLCDFAADVRAETPSGAAELISSNFLAGAEQAAQAAGALAQQAEDAAVQARARLDQARSRLRLLAPAAQVERGYLRLDDLSNRFTATWRHAAQQKRQALADARARLALRSPEARVQLASHRLLSLWKRLQSASPQSVLNRGFVIVRDPAGRPVPRRAGLRAGQRVSAQFADGDQPMQTLD
ncbi:MAG TPA: exodeoxyribonuclease VII large subunit [Opitutaceae bacterium]|nr:exodeoxyribonuclease VII large subunit [Opitutaceae bacterium]